MRLIRGGVRSTTWTARCAMRAPAWRRSAQLGSGSGSVRVRRCTSGWRRTRLLACARAAARLATMSRRLRDLGRLAREGAEAVRLDEGHVAKLCAQHDTRARIGISTRLIGGSSAAHRRLIGSSEVVRSLSEARQKLVSGLSVADSQHVEDGLVGLRLSSWADVRGRTCPGGSSGVVGSPRMAASRLCPAPPWCDAVGGFHVRRHGRRGAHLDVDSEPVALARPSRSRTCAFLPHSATWAWSGQSAARRSAVLLTTFSASRRRHRLGKGRAGTKG